MRVAGRGWTPRVGAAALLALLLAQGALPRARARSLTQAAGAAAAAAAPGGTSGPGALEARGGGGAGSGADGPSAELVAALRRRVSGGGAAAAAAAGAMPPGVSDDSYYKHGLTPSVGTVKALALLVDFPDYPWDDPTTGNSKNSRDRVHARMFTNVVDTDNFPMDSLQLWYNRSSFGKLWITGYTAPYYRAKHPRSYYKNLQDTMAAQGKYGEGVQALFEEALDALAASGFDFKQYDQNGNGFFDLIYLLYSGPYDDFWWPGTNRFYRNSTRYAGLRVGRYVWANTGGQYEFYPRTVIHETGHMMGLFDLYDYQPDVGPKGGAAGMDMMDATTHDHNGLSKWMLGWLEPKAVARADALRVTLRPASPTGDVYIFMPDANVSNPFAEYYMLEYRKTYTGNDEGFPGVNSFIGPGGLVIWHIDFRLDDQGSPAWNQHNTAHKMIAFVQADGRGVVELTGEAADVDDFYTKGKEFTPISNPNSSRYDGTQTGISITDITAAGGDTMSFTLSIKSAVGCPAGQGGAPCAPCRRGTFSAGVSSGACAPCPAGTTTPPTGVFTNASACSTCVPGFGGANCTACAVGSYGLGGSTRPACLACPTGRTTLGNRTANATGCSVCLAGYGGAACSLCIAGSYSLKGTALSPRANCTACPTGTTTKASPATSAAACSRCKPGFGTLGGGTACVICPVGWYGTGYNSAVDKLPCNKCPAPKTTKGPGATSLAACA